MPSRDASPSSGAFSYASTSSTTCWGADTRRPAAETAPRVPMTRGAVRSASGRKSPGPDAARASPGTGRSPSFRDRVGAARGVRVHGGKAGNIYLAALSEAHWTRPSYRSIHADQDQHQGRRNHPDRRRRRGALKPGTFRGAHDEAPPNRSTAGGFHAHQDQHQGRRHHHDRRRRRGALKSGALRTAYDKALQPTNREITMPIKSSIKAGGLSMTGADVAGP